MKEMDMLAAKIDILIKRLDERAQKKEAIYNTVKDMDLHMTCEVCGESGYSGNDCLGTHEDDTYINNGFRPQGGNNRWNNQSHPPFKERNSNFNSNYNSNQSSLIDLVLGQAQINKNLIKNITSNNKILENINANLEGLTSSFTNQLSLNKMFEIQLAQLAAILPAYHFENISGQSEISFENVNMVITRDGKSTHDLPYTNLAGEAKKHKDTTPNLRL